MSLRRFDEKDVQEAARNNDIDAELLLREIDKKEVVPLAIKPVTLNFLLNTYLKYHSFPSTQTTLYLEGCRLLCEEINDSRIDSGLKRKLTVEQLLIVAGRIATVTIFANKFAIWTSIDQGDVPDEDITVRDLCRGEEVADGSKFGISEDGIEETLGTGLFSSRGTNRMGWAHQTYAEFLTAWYLAQHKMTLTDIESLLVHSGDSNKKLVPQLHETAAWLANMVPEAFKMILQTEPQVLLHSDITTATPEDRANLVDSLLRLFDEEDAL